MSAVVHVTHEAVTKIGGIGAVLEGLVTAPQYQQAVDRTLLVGPLFSSLDEEQISRTGEVLYSSLTATVGIPDPGFFRLIEARYGVHIVYGRRPVLDATGGGEAGAEVVLVDCSEMDPELENAFKFLLYEEFGIQSERYEDVPDYIQYLRLAEPAYDVVAGLLALTAGPHFIIAHEYMGMPLALKAIAVGDDRFRTVFHAHEVATVRPLVEESVGHDIMFYNVLDQAAAGSSVEDVFGDQSGFYRAALVGCAHRCDAIFAVGDCVVRELGFLNDAFRQAPVDLVYNGIPAAEISLAERKAAIAGLQSFARNLTGAQPDYVFTHVTRLVPSKGLWRDLQVLGHLDGMLAGDGSTGVFFILTSAAATRSPQDVTRMETEYGWPLNHRAGYPDLDGAEVDLWADVDAFNRDSQSIRAVLVNQFGWSREYCGSSMPPGMGFMDLRRGTHVEFGQSIYEPFGIAQLEPLSFGATCVISNVCGCRGFAERVTGGEAFPNILVADYTSLTPPWTLDELLQMDGAARVAVESARSLDVAERLHQHLPRSDADLEAALVRGFDVARQMSWDSVARDLFLPGLERAAQRT